MRVVYLIAISSRIVWLYQTIILMTMSPLKTTSATCWADSLCLFALFRQNQPRICGKDTNPMEFHDWTFVRSVNLWGIQRLDQNNFGEPFFTQSSAAHILGPFPIQWSFPKSWRNMCSTHPSQKKMCVASKNPFVKNNNKKLPLRRKWRWQVSGQCSLSSHGVCQRLKGIPKRQLGWVRKFRSINWVTNERTKSAMKCSFLGDLHVKLISKDLSLFVRFFFTTSFVHHLKAFHLSPQSEKPPPTSMVVFLVDCPNAWPARGESIATSPTSGTWGKRTAPQRASQQWMHLFQPGEFGTKKKTTNSVGRFRENDRFFLKKSWILFLAICIGMSEKTPRGVWDPHMELHFKLKRALI